MKILLLGQSGFLGREIKEALAQTNHKVFSPEHKKLDVLTPQLEHLLLELQPEVVINCIAYTDVDGAETHPEEAYLLNSTLPERLAKNTTGRLIHFSTDYVFGGECEAGYHEEATPNPLSIYGKSKLEGERAVQKYSSDYLIIRTSFPFGSDPKCFLQKIIAKAEVQNDLHVVDDLVCSPTYFTELARRVCELVALPPESGIYHLTNFGACSRYEFARLALKILKLPNSIQPVVLVPTETAAVRPRYSTLLNTRLPELPVWNEALTEFLTRIQK